MRVAARLAVHRLIAHWRGWLALALLVGLAGGAVLAAVAGARRTDSAYQRYLTWSRASDVLVSPAGTGVGGYYDALARLPQVAAIAPVVGLNVEPLMRSGHPSGGAVALAPMDRRYGSVVDRPKILAGRMPSASRPLEIAVDQIGARVLRVHVGSLVTLEALPPNQPAVPASGRGAAGVRVLRARVVGIIVTRQSIDPVTDLDKVPRIIASTALWRLLGPRYQAFDGAVLRLRPGESAAAVGQEAQALARRFPGTRGQVYLADESAQAATVNRSIRPAAVALALFALVLAFAAVLILGQFAARILLTTSSDNPALSALGATRSQLLAAGLADVGVAGACGAVIGLALAVALSPVMPIGVARLAEPHPGVSLDATVLGIGTPAIVLLLVARAFWPAWQVAVRRDGAGTVAAAPASGSRLAGALAGLGAPVTMTLGVRLALEPGRGRTAVPVRSVLAGTMLSVLAVTGAFTFGANLVHLVRTPRLYGRTWDAAIDLQFSTISRARTAQLLGADPDVAGWSFGDHGIVTLRHLVVPAIGIAAGSGSVIGPTLITGRTPRTRNEIVLGTRTLQQIGKRVGQWVQASSAGHRLSMHIVGRAVFPSFGQGSFTPTDLGQGAETTSSLMARQAKPVTAPGFEFVLIRFKAGRDGSAATAALRHLLRPFCADVQQSTCLVVGQRPNAMVDYARIDAVPQMLGVLLTVLGLAMLSQLIVVSGRRRRRDFAVLRALGLGRHRVSVIIAWQVSTVALLACAVGVPLGVAAGRRSWAILGGVLGVPNDAMTPVRLVLLTVPAVLLIANAVALGPALAVARQRAAVVLRAE